MNNKFGLYNEKFGKDSCGVGFLTRKDGKQTHDLILKSHEALCSVPHRGGMSSEGVGDGAGISIDLSKKFFSKITKKNLEFDKFCVGNFFLPNNNLIILQKAAGSPIVSKIFFSSHLPFLSPTIVAVIPF